MRSRTAVDRFCPNQTAQLLNLPGTDTSAGHIALEPDQEILSFPADPNIQVGKNHSHDLTSQRELPGNILLEIGCVYRGANELTQSMSFGQVPHNFLDKASGQSFAKAFDAIAAQMSTGMAAASVTLQSWFENLVPGGTRSVAAAQASNIINGNISQVFVDVDRRRMPNGFQAFNNYMVQTLFLRSSTGASNYHAMFLTLEKHLSRGLLCAVNYTWSKSRDRLGAIQLGLRVEC